MNKELSASEALVGFAGWLTTRDCTLMIGASHDVAGVADLVQQFCVTNNLAEPRIGWQKKLTHPRRGLSRDSMCRIGAQRERLKTWEILLPDTWEEYAEAIRLLNIRTENLIIGYEMLIESMEQDYNEAWEKRWKINDARGV